MKQWSSFGDHRPTRGRGSGDSLYRQTTADCFTQSFVFLGCRRPQRISKTSLDQRKNQCLPGVPTASKDRKSSSTLAKVKGCADDGQYFFGYQ